MINWKQHLFYSTVFIIAYIYLKIFMPHYIIASTILLSIFITFYVIRHVISTDWISKFVRFILGKYF
jgi:hypothetical protein